MGAPATQGRLCTKLEEMEIGDYIKCEYIASNENAAGIFSNLGVSTAEELETTPATTANGYFYFVKVDKGILLADRLVQTSISYIALNSKGYISGASSEENIIRVPSQAEWTRYITNGDCNGNITKQDINVWNRYNANYQEILQETAKNTVRTALHMNGYQYDPGTHAYYGHAHYGSCKHFIYIYIPTSQCYSPPNPPQNGGGACASYRAYTSFRPLMEFVDNKKSKNIWF